MGLVKNKKGQTIRDTFLFMVFMVLLGIGFLFLFYINTEMKDSMLANPVLNASNETINVLNGLDTINDRLDYFVLVIFIGFALSMIILGWFIPVDAIFFWFYVLGMMFGVLMSILLNFIWTKFIAKAIFATNLSSFPITQNILDNLSIYYTIVAGIALIVTYAKPGRPR